VVICWCGTSILVLFIATAASWVLNLYLDAEMQEEAGHARMLCNSCQGRMGNRAEPNPSDDLCRIIPCHQVLARTLHLYIFPLPDSGPFIATMLFSWYIPPISVHRWVGLDLSTDRCRSFKACRWAGSLDHLGRIVRLGH